MIKYSLIALTAAAVLFSVGCEDSECCGVKSPEANVAPVVTRLLGVSNNGTKTCTPGSKVDLTADASDVNENLDTSTYSWVEKVGNNENTLGSSITCPADGEQTKICVTVKDKKDLESNEVCVNLKGQATPVDTSCNPHITVTDPNNDDAEVTSIVKGRKYDFHNNVVADDCPNVQCTWSVRSHRNQNLDENKGQPEFYTCLIDNSHDGVDDVPGSNGLEGNVYHVNLNGTGNTASVNVQTCASVYDYFEVTLNCTNPTVNEVKQYNLQ
jgi:hypothetical protein